MSLKDAEVLRAVGRASEGCGVEQGQSRSAIEAYAFY